MITFVLLWLAQFQVEGLKSNESFFELAPTVEPIRTFVISQRGDRGYAHVFGRVVDAYTGQPVAGAVIETWAEEIDEVEGGFRRLGEAMSGEDGRFQCLQGEKARIQAPGYLTWSDAGGALWSDGVELFPDSGFIPKIRIVDTSGRPIHNAVITSTYTCSHDVPMFEARTDSRGIALLRGFGQQDNIQELRLRATGFAGAEYLDGEPALLESSSEIYTVVMPRMERQIQLRLLNEDGSPFSSQPTRLIDGDCYHVNKTDLHGILALPFRYLSDFVSAYPLTHSRSGVHFEELRLVPPQQVALRILASDWPTEQETGKIQLQVPGDELPDFQLFHEDGWSKTPNNNNFEDGHIFFPAGNGFLHIGGPFNRFEEEWIEFDLTAEQTLQIQPKWIPQPTLNIQWPEETSGVWVQADEFSKSFKRTEGTLSVPRGQSLVFHGSRDYKDYYWEVEDPSAYYLESNPSKVLVLDEQFEIHPSFNPLEQLTAAKIEVILQVPEILAEQDKWRLENAYGELEDPTPVDGQPGFFSFHAPRGAKVLGVWRPDGHLPCWFEVIPGGTQATILHPNQPATVTFHSDLDFQVLGYNQLDRLEDLYPGPLNLVLQFTDGTRIGLQLNLESGEGRDLTILADSN